MSQAYDTEVINEALRPARDQFETLIRQICSDPTARMGHDQLESLINKLGTEVMRFILQGHLDIRAKHEREMEAKRKPIDKCADYLDKYYPMLEYDAFLSEGLPIASGVIEGACRHLIKDRLDRTGARWRIRSAEAIIRIRSLRSSGDFDAYWKFHRTGELQRNHTSQFAAVA